MMKDLTIEYQYIKLEDRQFATFEENFNEGATIELTNEVNFSFDFDACGLICSETVAYKQQTMPILKLSVASYFHINPESLKNITSEKGILMSKGILCQFASFNYGAMRGIMYEKTKNTSLNKLVLPPFYFNSIIKEDKLLSRNNS